MEAVAEQVYKERIQRAIDYIEHNLTGEVLLGRVAAEACWSAYHFMRTFHAITGRTVAEYIRDRRLDLAAYRLVFGNDRILVIAGEVGYETQEAFTRAFKRSYGATPGSYRAVGAYSIRRPRMDVIRALDSAFIGTGFGGDGMEPTIRQLGDLRIVGAELRTKGDGSNFKEIPQFWDRFLKEGTRKRIPAATDPQILYGLCTGMDDETGDFSYVIGADVGPDVEAPEGLGRFDVPATTYAVFTARGRFVDGEYSKAIQAMWKYAYGEWLPENTDWVRAEGDDFELYDDRRMNDSEAECDIYIPVRRKAE